MAQRNYTTIEKELLSIVETLKEFRSMLLGARLRIYTDHKNLTHQLTSFTTQRVMRWRILLEEFDCQFGYKTGESNKLADALSRVPTLRLEREDTPSPHDLHVFLQGREDEDLPSLVMDDDDVYTMLDEQPELADCLLCYPDFIPEEPFRYPFQFDVLRELQQRSTATKALLTSNPAHYRLHTYGDHDIICHFTKDDDPNPAIVLSDEMLPRVVRYFHLATSHAEGMDRLEATMRRHFYHPRLREEIRDQVGKCDKCQTNKRGGYQFGLLAPRDAPLSPWKEVHVDTIGKWSLQYKRQGKTLKITFLALTMIDPVTNLVEICRVPEVKPEASAEALENTWLSRYPRPLYCIHDGGSEFKLKATP
jgi:hypothetical protein